MLKLKKIDIAYWIFFFLFVSIFGVLTYTSNINTRTKNNFAIIEAVENLKSLNNEFDTLIGKKLQRLDIHYIEEKIEDLNNRMHFLIRENIHSKNEEISPKFKKITEDFDEKVLLLKEFNVHNNALIDAFNELHVRQANINKRYYFSPISQVVNVIVSDFTKSTYSGLDLLNTFYTNIKTLKNLVETNNLVDNELIVFLEHSVSASEHLKKINTITLENKKSTLEVNLNEFRFALVVFFENSIQKERLISYTLFFLIFCFLIVLVVTYRADKYNKQVLMRFRKAVENSDNSIVITDAKRLITYVNEAFEQISGYSFNEVVGKTPSILKSGKTKEDIYFDMNRKLESGQKWEGELVNQKKDGTIYYEKVSISPIVLHDNLEGFLAIKLDITDIIESKNKIESLAYYDQLTGLPNRIKSQEILSDLIILAQKNKTRVAMIIADLDRFKDINDALGHPIGDKLLFIIAFRLKNITQDKAFLARVGGDEFVILIECNDENNAVIAMSLEVINSVKNPIVIDNYTLSTSASIGISFYPDDAKSVADMIKNADSAMYDAKSKGKGRYQFFTQELLEKAQQRLNFENSMRYAMQRDEFS
ncbi:MAG: diguanylate cyclase, partial [Campylobacteraceae bacterium]|nr:diguanylate cyclase [Campylobacteraceae bacterium]